MYDGALDVFVDRPRPGRQINVGLAEIDLWSAEGVSVPVTQKSGNNPRSGFGVNRYPRGGQMRE
jgi:hypothetical protein